MAPRKKKPDAKLAGRTPVAEWVAAALGLALTLGVLGYSVWEGLTEGEGPPSLAVTTEAAERTEGGYALPIIVRNASHATAAGVEVRGVLEAGGQVVEERRAHFTYVPGRGEARGGLVFQHDPRAYAVRVTAEGYEEP